MSRAAVAAIFVAMLTAPLWAATYFVDPEKGSAEGDGSQAKPWKTLEQVVADGLLRKVKGGDTVLLRTGYHGAVTFSGDNAQMVTIAADRGQRPTLSRLEFSGSNWTVKGLVISPSFGEKSYRGNIVTFGEAGASKDLVIEDCYIYTVEDASKWSAKEWMSTNSGVNMGRHGRNLTLRNNYIMNTRFAVALCSFDSLCEGNVITDFSGDGIRATRDGQTIQYNVIKNIYVGASDGDNNHDDAIQCFLFNRGTGTVRNLKIIGNVILTHEHPERKFATVMQGIGFFDGPLVDFVVTDNVVGVEHWHGISLFDAQNALVERNVVFSPYGGRMKPWIAFDSKLKQSKNNTAKNNYAMSFKMNQPGTTSQNNKPANAGIYKQALRKAYSTITRKFGATHPTAKRPRLEK